MAFLKSLLHNVPMQSQNSRNTSHIDFSSIQLRPVLSSENERFKELLSKHHYLGCPAFIGETIKYVATIDNCWVALLSFSSAAMKVRARDHWIGWPSSFKWSRLHLIANNTRFLILPGYTTKNVASNVLSKCLKRLSRDWQTCFNHPLLMVETFVDPSRFVGTCYLASGWFELGLTKGYQKSNTRYIRHGQPKKIFVKSLHPRAREILRHPVLCEPYRKGAVQMEFNDKQVKSLFDCIERINDPRSFQGLRHHKPPLIAICLCATLCGAKGFAAIFDWASNLTKTMKRRLRLKCKKGEYLIPSKSTIRRFLIAIDPEELNSVLNTWIYKLENLNAPIAVDGKTMCGTSKKKSLKLTYLAQ